MQIIKARKEDIKSMVKLSDQKRRNYEKAQPQFWKRNEDANEIQEEWFAELIKKKEFLCYVVEEKAEIVAFVIGQLVEAPKVYDSGGLTLMIDDYCVAYGLQWQNYGQRLLDVVAAEARAQGATQILIVCGHHDQSKNSFLLGEKFSIASKWYVKNIDS
jgi:L-amino acid N-acyltransferase YncA